MVQFQHYTTNQESDQESMLQELLDYLFSPTGKPLYDKMVAVTKEDRKKHEGESPKKNEDPECFSIPVTIKGFYAGEVMCDLGSSANMMLLSLELKPCEVRI